MQRLRGGVFLTVLVLAVARCSSTPADFGTTASADTIDVSDALNSGLQFLCQYASTRTSEPTCQDLAVVGVCSQGTSSLDDATAALMAGPEAAKFAKTDADTQTTRQTIAEDFTTAINTCINGHTIEVDQQNAGIANDPQLQALAAAGRERFWHEEIRAVARTLNRTFDPVYAGSVVKNLRGLFLAGVCSAGAGIVGQLLLPPDSQQPAPSCSFTWDQTRIAHCVSSGATICSALGGFVDLGALGLQSDDDIVNWIEDAADVGVETLCRAGGPAASVACGTINVAGEQIAMALQTGDNDWAECLGISQAATCVGQWLGSGGWTNDSGVEMPRQVQGADGNTWAIRGCCECTRDDITRDRGWIWNTDTVTASSSWTSVIQQGDFATGNCGVKEGTEVIDDPSPSYWDRERHLHAYHSCQRVDVVGASCALQQADANGNLQSTPLQVWDADNNQPSQNFIRE